MRAGKSPGRGRPRRADSRSTGAPSGRAHSGTGSPLPRTRRLQPHSSTTAVAGYLRSPKGSRSSNAVRSAAPPPSSVRRAGPGGRLGDHGRAAPTDNVISAVVTYGLRAPVVSRRYIPFRMPIKFVFAPRTGEIIGFAVVLGRRRRLVSRFSTHGTNLHSPHLRQNIRLVRLFVNNRRRPTARGD